MDGLNKKRFFAFGCSYTGYSYSTWAELIGANFEYYMNLGRGGACNTYIMDKFIEIDTKYDINENDYVVVMFTSFDRFSYYKDNNWHLNGNVYLDTVPDDFKYKMWSDEWAIYNSWLSINTIKNTLKLKNVQHKLCVSMDNSAHLENRFSNYVKDFMCLLDVKEPMMSWAEKKYKFPKDFYSFKKSNFTDGHPTQKMHYDYIIEHFKEFDTEKTLERFKLCEEIFDIESFEKQSDIFNEKINKIYNKTFKEPIF